MVSGSSYGGFDLGAGGFDLGVVCSIQATEGSIWQVHFHLCWERVSDQIGVRFRRTSSSEVPIRSSWGIRHPHARFLQLRFRVGALARQMTHLKGVFGKFSCLLDFL